VRCSSFSTVHRRTFALVEAASQELLPELGAIERFRARRVAISPAVDSAGMLAEHACFRPITSDRMPLIGAAPGVQGLTPAPGRVCGGLSTRRLPTRFDQGWLGKSG
jgi:glycine/D-amino acid oxidase-like deaminating enzyme